MNRNFVFKLVVLAGAVLSTWAITTSIRAHFKQEQPKPEQPAELTSTDVVPSKKVTAEYNENDIDKPKPVSFLQSPPTADSQFMKSFTAKTQRHILNVQAEVEINDRRRDKSYVWTLYVLKASDDSAQLVHVYDNQVFTIPESGNLSPTFQETTELPSGKYKVFVTLSRLAQGADLSPLKDPKILSFPISLRGFEIVTID